MPASVVAFAVFDMIYQALPTEIIVKMQVCDRRAPGNGHINYSFCCVLPNFLAFA